MVTAITHIRRITMVVSRPRPPLLPPLLLFECVLESSITRAEIFPRARLAHSVPAVDSSTAVRHRRQHCRRHLFWIQKMLVFLLLTCQITQHRLPLSRVHALLRRLRTILMETSTLNVVPLSQILFFDGENARFQRRSPRSWFEFGDGNRASSAVSLRRGIKWAMGVRTPIAAPINHGTGACTLRASPQARIAEQCSCGDGASPWCFLRTCLSPLSLTRRWRSV